MQVENASQPDPGKFRGGRNVPEKTALTPRLLVGVSTKSRPSISETARKNMSDAAKKCVDHPGRFKKGYKLPKNVIEKQNKAKTGKPRSEATKQKIRISSTGSKNHNFGKRFSEETKMKLKKARNLRQPATIATRKKMSDSRKAEKCYNWKGGISYLPYCEKFNNDFKERVRAFFNYTCVECGTPQKGRNHNVHHVNYNKMMCCDRTKPLFICLCGGCNTKANYNREYWEQYFTNMIEGYYQGKCFFTKEEFTIIKSMDIEERINL
jgi:hypothetical protein